MTTVYNNTMLINANRLWKACSISVLLRKMHYKDLYTAIILPVNDYWVSYVLKTRPIPWERRLTVYPIFLFCLRPLVKIRGLTRTRNFGIRTSLVQTGNSPDWIDNSTYHSVLLF